MFQAVPLSLELSDHFGTAYPEFMYSTRFEVEKRLPKVKYELYSYTTKNSVYYYGIRRYYYTKNEVNFCCFGSYNKEEFLAGFKIFWNSKDPFGGREELLFIAYDPYVADLLPFLQAVNKPVKLFPCFAYYMTKEQEELLMKSEAIALPEGYELGSAAPEDAKLMTDCWTHRGIGNEEEQTKVKLRAFPSSCVRYHGQPVAFEMLHPYGQLNHQFVMEEHRGKGLGNVVEQDLARKLIRIGFFVYKTVEIRNTPVASAAERSPYWTTITGEDGKPKIMTYVKIINEAA